MFKPEAQAQMADFRNYDPHPIGTREHIEGSEDAVVSLSASDTFEDEIALTLASKTSVFGPFRLSRIAAEQLRARLEQLAPPALRV